MSNIKVTYKYIDGAHFFVSSDKDAAGLCVAHADLQTAFEEVSNQLSVLFEHNRGEKWNFKPGVPFEIFKKWAGEAFAAARDADRSGMITPASIQPWVYEGRERQ
jgi:hypothetical protein